MTKVYAAKGDYTTELLRYVQTHPLFTIEEVRREFDYAPATARAYLSRLARNYLIHRLARGYYATGKAVGGLDAIPPLVWEVNNAVRNELPFADVVIWSTESVTQFSPDVMTTKLIVIEGDEDALKNARSILLTSKKGGFSFIREEETAPLGEVMFFSQAQPVLLVRRGERYGTRTVTKGDVRLTTATIEKMVVDVYVLSLKKGFPMSLRFPLPRGHLKYCVETNLHQLNLRRLHRYAVRRGLGKEIGELLLEAARERNDKEIEKFAVHIWRD